MYICKAVTGITLSTRVEIRIQAACHKGRREGQKGSGGRGDGGEEGEKKECLYMLFRDGVVILLETQPGIQVRHIIRPQK